MNASMIFALIIFTFFSVLGILMGLFWSFRNDKAFEMLSTPAGFDLKSIASESEGTGRAMKFLLLDFTSQLLGFNLLALLIVWFPFRNGEIWAWFALAFYPLMFLWHYFHYAKKTFFSAMQLVYMVLAILALLLNYGRFFGS